MRFDKGATLLARGVSAGMQGGIDAAQQLANSGHIDPAQTLAIAAAGAVLPATNRVGAAVEGAGRRMVPGRPGKPVSDAAAPAHADVGDQDQDINVSDSALADSPPRPTGATVGAPAENSPTNSRGEVATGKADASYAKGTPPADAQNDMLTQGQMDPATEAALKAANPEPETPAPTPQQPQQTPLGMPAQNFRMPEPSVEAGFPQTGEPVAAGANDATPMPPAAPAKAAAAIERSQSVQTEPVKENKVTGKTVPNASLSDAQKESGIYQKKHSHDFGKPTATETEAGDTRTGKAPDGTEWKVKMPYDYGYFNKTKSTDGDGIDWAQPKPDAPERGDKHFIVDQRDPATGKYDEPKVFRDVKDKATAIDLYNRGFSDGKGPSRMHDITEVTRPQVVKYLAKHTSVAPTKPYGSPMPKAAKPAAEKAVVKDLVEKLKAQGKDAEAEKVLATPDAQLNAAVEGKRVRKYGVETGSSAGYPIEGIVNSEGKPVTANTKLKAQERSAKHKEVTNWFEGSKPPSQMDLSKETNGELLDRIKPGPGRGDLSGWVPTHKPKEWMWAREADRLMKKPTPGNIEKFRDAERLLRGDDAAVETYRGGNRVEADVAMNKRGGDENIAAAEGKLHAPGVNENEDAMIAAIDAKRGGKFDTPHEEAERDVTPMPVKSKADLKQLPRKTVNVKDSALAQVDMKKVDDSAAAKRKDEIEVLKERRARAEASKARAKAANEARTKVEANKPSEDIKAEGKKDIGVKDFTAADMQRMVELSNKAAKRKGLSDDEIAQSDLTKQEGYKPKNETAKLFDRFTSDESGSLNIGKIKQDIKNLLKTTPVKSYRARDPKGPSEEHALTLSEDLHKVNQAEKAHKLNTQDWTDALPKEADRPMLERIYKAREADSAHVDLPGKQAGKTNIESLDPADKKIWDDVLGPKSDEVDAFDKAIRAINPDLTGPEVEHYISRITKGNTSEFNILKSNDDPTGPKFNGMSVNASMAKERGFVALERASDGKRFVIQNRPEGGFTLWDNRKATRIKDPNYEFEANMPYTVKGKNGDVDYTMRHAMSDEIENSGARLDLGNGKTQLVKYYKNAAFSIAMAHTKLGTMARNLQELARISSTPEFGKLTSTNPESKNPISEGGKGYKETNFPNLKGTYMDPQLAHVFDDYAKAGFNSPQMLRDLNQSVTKLLFWMPVAHIANVGTHWFVGRGLDNLNAKALFETGAKAISSVMKQDVYQRKLMEHGAGTIYPSVLTRNFIEKIAKNVGEEMVRDPSSWGPIADKLGVPLKKLSDSIYNASSKVMWAANDVFLTQRIMELERKGMSMEQAIKVAERDIPNYRVSPTLLGSGQKGRIFSQVMQDPMVTSFGRYHVGMFNSYANIAKDALSGSASAGDRIDAIGKMMAMAVLAYAVYPVMDKMAKLVTGNEDASQNRRGPISVPYHVGRAMQGKEDIASAGRATFTIPPFWSTLMESLSNKDWRGKSIVEPGDVAAGARGDAFRGGRALVQEGEHFARGMISPLGTLSTAEKKNKDDNIGVAAAKAVRDQAADVRNPSQAASNYERKQDLYNERASRSRDKKGGYGPLEEGYNKLFGH